LYRYNTAAALTGLAVAQTVRFVFTELRKAEFKATMLHGDRSQVEREAAVRDFKAGKCQILVATDVAARGLHVKNLPYIVNYDFPGNLETYIHRVGRTGALLLSDSPDCCDRRC
jgi:superfamily II DNA/RNA helicase